MGYNSTNKPLKIARCTIIFSGEGAGCGCGKKTDLEPVDGAAVDERRELPQPVAERVTDGRHGEYDVQLVAAALDEHVEESHRRAVRLLRLVALAIELTHLLNDLLFLVEREEVGHLAGVQQVVDVLQKRLLLDLGEVTAVIVFYQSKSLEISKLRVHMQLK